MRPGMLCVLIETTNDGEGLALTLSSLIGAAIEGVVREVIVCDRVSSGQTARVADHAGCTYLAGGDIAAGIRRARGDWLVILEPGARLDGEWTGPVLAHLNQGTSPARFSRSRHDGTPFLSRIFSSRRPLAGGLIISKRQAAALARTGGDAASLARSVKAKRLEAEIIAAPKRP